MRNIKFRPLRRIKKTGKVVVASYMQWRKVKTADYSNFALVVNAEYKLMPPDEYVYDHNGEQLFWFNYMPDDIVDHATLKPDEQYNFEAKPPSALKRPDGRGIFFMGYGMDTDGVPTFTHLTANAITASYSDMNQFEPLTVGMVVKWLGWFLYQLENNTLEIKTP